MKDWRDMRIAAVAISIDGTYYWLPPPARHHDVIREMSERYGISSEDISRGTQGFMTECGEFVMRRPAFLIAEHNGQLNRSPNGYQGLELFSEDLW